MSQGSGGQEALCVPTQPASAQLHCPAPLVDTAQARDYFKSCFKKCAAANYCSCVLVVACPAACMEFHGAACGQAMEVMAGRQVFLPQLATSDCGSSWSGLTGALTATIGGTSWCLMLVSGALQTDGIDNRDASLLDVRQHCMRRTSRCGSSSRRPASPSWVPFSRSSLRCGEVDTHTPTLSIPA